MEFLQGFYECPEGCSDGVCLGEPIPLGENECFESDERLNLYEKGHLIDKQHSADYWDTCLDENTLREYYCGPDNYLYYSFNCPNGCQDGACLGLTAEQTSKSCEDSDALYPIWVNFNEKGIVKAEGGLNRGTYEETCEGDSVKEYICDVRGALEIKYDCTYGCKDGACLTPTYIEPKEEEEPLEVPRDTEETIYICQGCEFDSKCYPFGFRKDGNFCSDENNRFIEQKKPETICENNFECDSNLCINNECVSGTLWDKLIRWLSGIFG